MTARRRNRAALRLRAVLYALVHGIQTDSEPQDYSERTLEAIVRARAALARTCDVCGFYDCVTCRPPTPTPIEDSFPRFDRYRLPDGTIVDCDATATKGAAVIDFTLRGGAIVKAVKVTT